MTEQRKTINDLIEEGHAHIIITSDQDSALVISKKNTLRPLVRKYTTEELIEWLNLHEIPQLKTGQYWREYKNYSIYGGLQNGIIPPGSKTPIEPYFEIIIAKQTPAKFKPRNP